jgi:hypothetical protein
MSDHYCTVLDLNDLVPQAPFGPTSVPKETTAVKMIEATANRIDATLANLGYVTPVTGTKSLGLLRELCAWGALGLCLNIRGTGVNVAVGERGAPVDNIWTVKFTDALKALGSNKNPFELPDAQRTDQQVIKQDDSLLRSNVFSDETRMVDSPTITRDQVL